MSPPGKRTFAIKNKLARQRFNVKIKSSSSSENHKFRAQRRKDEEKNPELRVERLKKNIPVTLDRARVWDERVSGAYQALKEQEVRKRKVEDEMEDESEEDGKDESEEDGKDEEMDDIDVRRKKKARTRSGEGKIEEEVDSEGLAEAAHEAAMQARAEAAEAALLYPTLPNISAFTKSTSTSSSPLEPKLLITTSRNSHMHSPAHELATIFPNSTYIPRGRPQNSARKGAKTKPKQFSIPEICSFASSPPASASGEPATPYTHVAVINEHQKKPSGLTIIALPSGPSFHFSMTNYIPSDRLHNHGRATSHTPELILNNFLTPLGKLAAGLFQSMFPPMPELGGRQVVTLHNQRDYIFFRRHRYMFRERRTGEKAVGYGLDHGQNTLNPVSEGVEERDLGVKVGLQELGPQFTLKLRKVEKGVCEGVEWQWKGEMEKERRKFQL
ncbi:RNA processing factor [Tirmania nivea]|nr:RNA processing factor [Tirmania nivea]